jgi:hypothetical protein
MNKAKTKPTAKTKASTRPKVIELRRNEADADREAVLTEREKLGKLFPPRYAADIAVIEGDRVEVILKMSYSQAESLARLLHDAKL